MSNGAPTVHASAVLAGARAVLIRGPPGAGKSRLAFALLAAAQTGLIPFARLIGDDRVHIESCHGRLLVRPAAALAGLIEVRGVGIRQVPHEPVGAVGLLIDLAAEDAARVPEATDTVILGIALPQLAVAARADPFLPVLSTLIALNLGHDHLRRPPGAQK